MISGTTVTVLRPNFDGTDRFGEPVEVEPTAETVDNVLIAPGATDDLEASRPDGVRVDLTLHFPKTYNQDLRGCTVMLPAPWANEKGYRVIGEPKPYMDANTPTKWHMPVEVVAVHG